MARFGCFAEAAAVRMRGRVPLEDVGAVLELLVNLRLTLQPQTVGLQALLRRVALPDSSCL